VSEDADEDAEMEAGETLWRAVRIVVIADIIMSLDNVIAIAAAAELAAAMVDPTHAAAIKAALIIFGLATSVPLIIAGSAILMALLERFRVLVWGGGALLGWVAMNSAVAPPTNESGTARDALLLRPPDPGREDVAPQEGVDLGPSGLQVSRRPPSSRSVRMTGGPAASSTRRPVE